MHLPWARFELTTSVVIDTDFIGSCKSNYHTIMATTTPCRREGLRYRFKKTDHHDITEILPKVTLSTINQPYILYRMVRLLIDVWQQLMWNDPRLRWEGEPHSLRLPTSVIWTPDIVLYNK
jgi:hypothetical protein